MGLQPPRWCARVSCCAPPGMAGCRTDISFPSLACSKTAWKTMPWFCCVTSAQVSFRCPRGRAGPRRAFSKYVADVQRALRDEVLGNARQHVSCCIQQLTDHILKLQQTTELFLTGSIRYWAQCGTPTPAHSVVLLMAALQSLSAGLIIARAFLGAPPSPEGPSTSPPTPPIFAQLGWTPCSSRHGVVGSSSPTPRAGMARCVSMEQLNWR